MVVYRIENPNTRMGPFRDLEHPIQGEGRQGDRDWRQIEIAIKGGVGLDGTPYARAHSPGWEWDMLDPDYKQRIKRSGLYKALTHGGEEFVWGCQTISNFDFWFPHSIRPILARYGFKEAVYEVPDDRVLELPSQCAFDPSDAKKVEYRPL